MKVLVTGANGFLGKNLQLYLRERSDVEVRCFTREQSLDDLVDLLTDVDFVFHLAGINRPQDPQEYVTGNADLTRALCGAVAEVAACGGKKIPVLFTSSIQSERDNPYGQSKQTAERVLFELQREYGVPVHIFRLPNVFGKWCKPNYNSAVATFCHNIAYGLPIQIHDPAAILTLVYVDDVIERFIQLMDGLNVAMDSDGFMAVTPLYSTTVGEVADLVQRFKVSRETLITEKVGVGLVRKLYATYVSYLPKQAFSYPVPQYGDARGVFVEMLKTPNCGQFSFFTAYSGVTRGGHYHHSKTEKFLVIMGEARFRFRHMQTGEDYELMTRGGVPEIVDTVPGWTHDITNVGEGEMVVMIWASEIFDRDRPDTYVCLQ